jgi:TonB family protein
MLGLSDTSIGIVSSLVIHVGVAVACFGSLGDGNGVGEGAVEVAIHGPEELRDEAEHTVFKEATKLPLKAPQGPKNARLVDEKQSLAESAPSAPQNASKKPQEARDDVLEEARKRPQEPGGGGLLGTLFSPIVAIDVPKPEYPTQARRRGVEGVVVLRVRVEADGRLSDANVVTSSGSELLDESALISMRRATFRPALQAGIPVAADKKFSVRFSLTE